MRQIGLRDLHVAIITEDTVQNIAYEKPSKLERSITAKITPSTSSEKLYSDDSLEEVINSFDSIDVEFEINQLSLESRKLLQGSKLSNGVLVENKDDQAVDVAIAFRSKKSDGTFRYVWLLSGKFELNEDNFETIADKITAQSSTLKGTFKPREHDGNYRIIADEVKGGGSGVGNADIISKWFDAVPVIAADGTVTAGTSTPSTPATGLTFTAEEGAASGHTKVSTITPTLTSGNTYKYQVGASEVAINVGDSTSTGWTAYTLAEDISATANQVLTIVEVDNGGKAVKAGHATVVLKA